MVLRIFPDPHMELQALNLYFMTLYKVMQCPKLFLWRTMVAANGVIFQISTNLPGINDLSKVPSLSVNWIPKRTDYIKLKILAQVL